MVCFFVVDNNSLHWDDTYPYKYLPQKELKTAREKRRQLILNCLNRKIKVW